MKWSRDPEYLVQVRWLTPEEGGRQSGPPELSREASSEYRGLWIATDSSGWAFLLHPADESEPEDVYEAVIPFASNGAPALAAGDDIRLVEGARRVAVGRIIRALI